MATAFNLIMLMILFITVRARIALSTPDKFIKCENKVRNWAAASLDDWVSDEKLKLRDLLFFLHIPRTGGRTYFHCFLRKLYTHNQECPRSYDKLRFDPSKPNCRLMVTHDDYSMMSKLPREIASVITILRNPVDRVFSTYEFSVEVAARFLVHPNLTSATQMTKRIRPKAHGVSTLDIWPWKYLVPWMREDLFARRESRKLRGLIKANHVMDTYNMEDVAMPFHIFINDPLAHEIIHNGATFQVAGLTNNSFLDESHKIRHCVMKYPALGEYVLQVAKKRLDDMLYVGLTEYHRESAMMFAEAVGSQVLSQLKNLNPHVENMSNVTNSEDGDSEGPNHVQMTVEKLMGLYEDCVSGLWKSQSTRRTSSLKRISPANFSKEARSMVPEKVIQNILSLNKLDVDLYKHAETIFSDQRQYLAQKFLSEDEQNVCNSLSIRCLPWASLLLALTIPLLILLFFYLYLQREHQKIKCKL